ncbi:MAG: GYF domain-containing protein [Pirellulales bacterium]
MAREWYCQLVGAECGPFEPAQLRAMARGDKIAPEDLVRRGTGPWVEARKVRGLFDWPTQPVAPKPLGVRMAGFQANKRGMSYTEVIAILGAEQVGQSRAKISDDLEGVDFDWSGGLLKRLSVYFQNDVVQQKIQIGLKQLGWRGEVEIKSHVKLGKSERRLEWKSQVPSLQSSLSRYSLVSSSIPRSCYGVPA